MHLCDVTMFHAPHGGGVRRYLAAKHDWLSQHGVARHTLLTPGPVTGWQAPGHRVLKAPPLPFSGGYRFPMRKGPWVDELVRLSPDLIEAGDPYRLGWAALDAGARLGVAVVGYYHSDFPRMVAARFGTRAERLARRYVRRLYSNFDLVLSPSHVMREHLREAGVDHCRVQPLGVDPQVFHPTRRSPRLRLQLGIGARTHLLVFAGRYAREKNIDGLIEAFRVLGPRFHLLLVGPDMPRSPAANVTVFARYVDSGELAGLLASSDALVHAGGMETFGLIVLEAMACGIPVVGISSGAVPELLSGETGTLATSGSPAALAEAIAALFDCDLHRMGHAARQSVEMRWSWDCAFRRLHETYLELLATPPVNQRDDTMYAAR